jgi:hypothetical protein
VLYTRSIEASGAPFLRSYGDRFTNSGKECTIEWPSTQRLGVCLSLFLITHILRKKGIKGNATDGPITESPHFGRIQWNQSCSHMPRAAAAPEPELELEPMDIQEMATEQERAAKPERVAEFDEQPEEEEEFEEMITLRATDFYALQDTLEDIRFQIADIQRDARQDKLETQEML